MRILVLGAGGMLGQDLLATSPSGYKTIGLARKELDIRDEAGLTNALASVRPNVVINAAAYTAVDRAEADRDEAFATNGVSVGRLGTLAHGLGCLVLHYSTDYIFRGDSVHPYLEDSPPDPVNVYGASKLAGERALVDSGARNVIVRTSWLFGIHGRSFPRTMWTRAKQGLSTRVVNDQTGRPTFSLDLARASWALVASGRTGTFHVTNSGITTWHDLATRVFARAGRADLLTPCTSAEYPTTARRPAHSSLGTRHTTLPFEPLRGWQQALDDFLDQLTLANA